MARKLQGNDAKNNELNLIPLIDAVFLLLVFSSSLLLFLSSSDKFILILIEFSSFISFENLSLISLEILGSKIFCQVFFGPRLKNLNLHDIGRNISVGLKYSF